MNNAPERIPIPWPQRRELLLERAFPALCFVATVLACAALWRYQTRVAPFAMGEVHSESATVRSPHSGELLPLDGYVDGEWPLFTEVKKGDVIARLKRNTTIAGPDGPTLIDDEVTIEAPMNGFITKLSAHPGEKLQKGDKIVTVSSGDAKYVICHLPFQGQELPKAGGSVAIRPQGRGAEWTRSVIQAVGPVVEEVPTYEGVAVVRPGRGLPLRIAAPPALELKPGSLVEVRLAMTDAAK